MAELSHPNDLKALIATLRQLEQHHGLILLWADEELTVTHASPGATSLLIWPEKHAPLQLTDLCLELIGLEDILKKIARGEHAPISFEFINRDALDNSVRYFDLFVYPNSSGANNTGLLLVILDTTQSGNMARQLRQLRAEKARLS